MGSRNVGPASGQAPPAQRPDELGDRDRFGVGRSEEPRRAEGVVLGLGRDEQLSAAIPVVPGVAVDSRRGVDEVPVMGADQEAGQDRVEGGGRAETLQ